MNRRRARWSHATITLAVIAAVAIAGPALGGGQSATIAVKKKALKKLIRKEVAKQIGKATGPLGANGLNGLNGANGASGTNGADGTARAYARVVSDATDNCAGGCTFDQSKGVTSVIEQGTGDYCVVAPGISPASVAPAVTVDGVSTQVPRGNASAMPLSSCMAGSGFRVLTQRLPTTLPVTAMQSNDVGFTIVIP